MKITFPSGPIQKLEENNPPLTDLLQQPEVVKNQQKVKSNRSLTAEDLQKKSSELKKTNIDPAAEANMRRRKTSLIKRLEAECARDKAALSQTAPLKGTKKDVSVPRFEMAKTILTKIDLPKDALLEHLEKNFSDFIQKPVNTQWRRDVLLDAMIKTPEEWKTELFSVFENFAPPDAKMSRASKKDATPRDVSLENKIDALIARFQTIMIESGPNRFGADNNTLHLEGRPFVKAAKMGSGFNGSVTRYVHQETGDTVAVKSPLFGPHTSKEAVDKFRNQIRLHRFAMGPDPEQNESIIPLKGAVIDQNGLPHLVMAEAGGGDFRKLAQTLDYLIEIQVVPYAAKAAVERSVCVQAAQGIDFLHELGLVHSDIKRGNVVLEENGKAKLADFDLTAVAASPQQSLATQAKALAAKSRFLKAFVKEGNYSALVPEDNNPKKDVFSFSYLLPDSSQVGAVGRLDSKAQGDYTTPLLIPNSKGILGSAYLNQEDFDQDQIDKLTQTVIQFQQSLSENERKAIDDHFDMGGPSEYVERDGYEPEMNEYLRRMHETSNSYKIEQMRAVREKADSSGFTSRLREASRPFEA
ncbi:MAG TPA: protein kinase family protein [Noviherbaspirillum sp.]|nr:protein kinase family protein [Noviherbaspirillum sp.]